MEHPAESKLKYLERCCPPRNDKWRHYIADQSVQVFRWISVLRGFAAQKPDSQVAHNCIARADALEARLIAVLRQ